MLNMTVKSISRVKVASSKRTRFIGLRVREHDAEILQALAKKEGVGLSTYARLILEEYASVHGKRR